MCGELVGYGRVLNILCNHGGALIQYFGWSWNFGRSQRTQSVGILDEGKQSRCTATSTKPAQLRQITSSHRLSKSPFEAGRQQLSICTVTQRSIGRLPCTLRAAHQGFCQEKIQSGPRLLVSQLSPMRGVESCERYGVVLFDAPLEISSPTSRNVLMELDCAQQHKCLSVYPSPHVHIGYTAHVSSCIRYCLSLLQ